jgi:hypothetical protein
LILTLIVQAFYPLILTKFEITIPKGARAVLLGEQHKIASVENRKQDCTVAKLIKRQPSIIYLEAADHKKSSFNLLPERFQEATIKAEKTIGKHALLGNYGILNSFIPAGTEVHKINMRSVAQFIFFSASEKKEVAHKTGKRLHTQSTRI